MSVSSKTGFVKIKFVRGGRTTPTYFLGYSEAPWFCVVVVSDICVDEVEDLVPPPCHVELLLRRLKHHLQLLPEEWKFKLCLVVGIIIVLYILNMFTS